MAVTEKDEFLVAHLISLAGCAVIFANGLMGNVKVKFEPTQLPVTAVGVTVNTALIEAPVVLVRVIPVMLPVPLATPPVKAP